MRWIEIKNHGRWRRVGVKAFPRNHDLIEIMGNQKGLLALRDAIDRALLAKNGNAECSQSDAIGEKRLVKIKARSL